MPAAGTSTFRYTGTGRSTAPVCYPDTGMHAGTGAAGPAAVRIVGGIFSPPTSIQETRVTTKVINLVPWHITKFSKYYFKVYQI